MRISAYFHPMIGRFGEMGRPIVLASNRGPVSFADEDGELVARRGAGGLVSGLAPLVAATDALWIAAAMTDGDRRIAHDGITQADDFRVQLVDIDPDVYRMAYDVMKSPVGTNLSMTAPEGERPANVTSLRLGREISGRELPML